MKTLKRQMTAWAMLILLLGTTPHTVRGEDVYNIANATELNRALYYIYPLAPLPTLTNSGSPTSTSFGLPRPSSIKIEPGMKLIFRATLLRTKGTNTQTPGLMVYEWIAPETLSPRATNRFTREDYFFLQYMLAAGIPVNCDSSNTPSDQNLCNTIEQFEELKRTIQTDGSSLPFWDRLSQRVLVPSFRSLMLVTQRNSPFTAPNRSASELRELLAEPSVEDFDAREERNQYLRLSFPGRYKTLEINIYDWSSAFFNDSVRERQNVDRSQPWYGLGSSQFSVDDFIDAPKLVSKLKDGQDAVSSYLRSKFAPATREQLNRYISPQQPSQDLLNAIVADLNDLLGEPSLYDQNRFSQVALAARTRNLLNQNPSGDSLVRLNRFLLEDAYPHEIAKSQENFPSGSRGYIEVMVPVRITYKSDRNLSTSDYFPVYYSVANIEQRLGITIRGFRRSEHFAGNFTLTKKQINQQKLISPKDGYFTLWFDKSKKGYGSKAVLRVEEQRKKDILLAPGDIIIVDKRRLGATDHPEVR